MWTLRQTRYVAGVCCWLSAVSTAQLSVARNGPVMVTTWNSSVGCSVTNVQALPGYFPVSESPTYLHHLECNLVWLQLCKTSPHKNKGVIRTRSNISGGKWCFVTTQVGLKLLFKELRGNFVHWRIFGSNLKETKLAGLHWRNFSVPRDRTWRGEGDAPI